MAQNKEFIDTIKQLSIKYNTDYDLVEKIVRTQFKFIKDTIEQGELDSVHLHYFGKFCVKPNRIQMLKDNGYPLKKKNTE